MNGSQFLKKQQGADFVVTCMPQFIYGHCQVWRSWHAVRSAVRLLGGCKKDPFGARLALEWSRSVDMFFFWGWQRETCPVQLGWLPGWETYKDPPIKTRSFKTSCDNFTCCHHSWLIYSIFVNWTSMESDYHMSFASHASSIVLFKHKWSS